MSQVVNLGEGYYDLDCAKFVPKELVKNSPHREHNLSKTTLLSGWVSEGAKA